MGREEGAHIPGPCDGLEPGKQSGLLLAPRHHAGRQQAGKVKSERAVSQEPLSVPLLGCQEQPLSPCFDSAQGPSAQAGLGWCVGAGVAKACRALKWQEVGGGPPPCSLLPRPGDPRARDFSRFPTPSPAHQASPEPVGEDPSQSCQIKIAEPSCVESPWVGEEGAGLGAKGRPAGSATGLPSMVTAAGTAQESPSHQPFGPAGT